MFPAVGYRNNSNGALNNNGTNGYYWASDQNNASNAYNMYFNSSNVNTGNNNKANGYSVRCVRQEFTTLIFKALTFIDIKGDMDTLSPPAKCKGLL